MKFNFEKKAEEEVVIDEATKPHIDFLVERGVDREALEAIYKAGYHQGRMDAYFELAFKNNKK